MPMSSAVDQTKTLLFIEDYRSCISLWDSSHKDYNKKIKRNGALECLAINHNLSIGEVKNKIKCLRSYFSKEHQKVIERSDDDDYESAWFAYKPMEFILLSKAPNAEENNNDYKTGVHVTHLTAEREREPIRRPVRRKINLKRARENEKDPEMHHLPQIASVQSLPKDEFSIFGQMVASQIRKLNRRNQAIAKNTIQNFLFDMEMREISAAEENATQTDATHREIILQTLSPSSPSQILKNGNSVYADYAVACKKIEEFVN